MPGEEADERLLETIFEDACKAAAMVEDDWWALSQFLWCRSPFPYRSARSTA